MLTPPHLFMFFSSIDSHPIPKSLPEALSNLGWRAAMQEKMEDLEQNGSKELVVVVGTSSKWEEDGSCLWVYKVKLNCDSSFAYLKTSAQRVFSNV